MTIVEVVECCSILIIFFVWVLGMNGVFSRKEKQKEIYKYFIAYEVTHKDGRTHKENTDVHLPEKITSLQEIWEIERYIQRHKVRMEEDFINITIINFINVDRSDRYWETDLSK